MRVESRFEWRLADLDSSLANSLNGSSGRSADGATALAGARGQLINSICLQTGLSRLTVEICVQRGMTSADEIHRFMNPRLDQLTSPFKMRDMELAIERVREALARAEKVRVFGDYDVDGTTGAALLHWGFAAVGLEHDIRQPDRFKDGYGLNVGAVEDTHAQGIKLLITVDCGITSFAAAERARELGIDLIVLDHHQISAEKGLPPAFAIVNPQRADCESGLKQLCGCGIAFYFLMALRSRGREQGWISAEPSAHLNLKQHLDLVVMATAADMVPLTGDNHILVKQGLQMLKVTTKPGVRALLEEAGVRVDQVSPGHLGFVIGPRINASGRLASADMALRLLCTQDPAEGKTLATALEALNRERAEIQNRVWDEVRARVEAEIAQGRFKNAIAIGGPDWHEGVVGIVASRVTETFKRPAAVLALREDFGKGSVRSYGGKDVLAALQACAPVLRSFGGHRHAAGLSVEHDQLEAFVQAFDDAVGLQPLSADSGSLRLDAVCSLDDLDLKTIAELENLGPFGPGNPEPVLSLPAGVLGFRVLKERHLKLQLGLRTGGRSGRALGRAIDAIWFNAAERMSLEDLDQLVERDAEWAVVPELNRFRGQVTPTLRIRDGRTV